MSNDQIALIIIGSAVLLSVLLALIAAGMSGRVSEEERRRELERVLAQPDARGGLRQGVLIPDDDVAWQSFQQEMTRPNPRGDLR